MTMWMGVLALETGAAATHSRWLSRECAEALTPRLLAQLGRLLSPDHAYGFSWAAALYDPAQLLRRGFRVHTEIHELFLAGRDKGLDSGQSLTLMQHQGQMPTRVLEPEAELGIGTLQVIPVVLTGSDDAIDAAREALESSLYEMGLVDAASALLLGKDLGSALEHVRWMSLLDLAAMMAAQLGHVGLAPAWELIEEHLFAAAPQELAVTSTQGNSMQLDPAGIRLEFPSFARFVDVRSKGAAAIEEYLARVHEFRQLQALLSAHGLAATIPGAQNGFFIETCGDTPCTRYRLHTHPALGALAWTGFDASGAVVEQLYPLEPAAARRQLRALEVRGVPVETGQICLTADGLDLGGSSPI